MDVDVVFSPFFNALPIRRTGLYQRAESLELLVVHVRLPELTVELETISYASTGSNGINLEIAGRRDHHHRRRRRLHPRLPRTGNADLITPPARPAAASSSRHCRSADGDGRDVGPAEAVVADPCGVTRLDEIGHRGGASARSLAGPG